MNKNLLYRTLRMAAAALIAVTWGWLPAGASSPTGHIIIAEQVMRQIMKDPNANPELKDLLRGNPDARRAFSGGACAPDLDSLADGAHSRDPKGTADAIMGTARANLRRAEAALAAATTPAQKAAAERVLKQAQCDVAFAYGWLTHAAADLETHPVVNASGEDYWDDETRNRYQEQLDQAEHGEWEVMQEANWIDKYGPPLDPNVDYRLGLLEQALGFEHNDLLNDVQTLSKKESASAFVGDKYTQGQLDTWKPINDGIGDRSIDLAKDFVNSPGNPLDNSCWDIGRGISLEDFRKFIEDTKKANGGKLPEGFWVGYDTLFNNWKSSATSGTSTGTAGSPPAVSGSSGVSSAGVSLAGSNNNPAGTPGVSLIPDTDSSKNAFDQRAAEKDWDKVNEGWDKKYEGWDKVYDGWGRVYQK
ncbi:MAG TPA: zinc dependent phospholipase C family protein [Desulfobacteraceae bacterium]|nr:zinc dependent phospholipase C family protein [Desulfobacteraceae bacterium]HPQ28997.1 zinc dependent phospholipase C family protein [Desulfobacteraceae bacterium]